MNMKLPRVLLISTGGTIAMTPSGGGSGIAPTLLGEDLVRAVPELAQRAVLEVVSYSAIPSASLTLGNLVDIARLIDARMGEGFSGAVVVQGTDTLEETAFVLDLLLASDCPVVVTGAMRGASAPGADGPANLLAAVTVASSAIAKGLGTVAVLNDEIHAARYVQKSHTALPSAFASPGFAPVGRVIEEQVHVYARLPRPAALELPQNVDDFPLALLKIPLGDDGRMLGALPELGYRGAVIEAMGAGHLPAHFAEKIQQLATVMPVVLATRLASGPVFQKTYGFKGAEIDLISRGAIPGGYLSGTKASLLLRLLLANGLTGEVLRTAYAARSNAAFIEAKD